jgi:hypothetical protein
MQQNRICRISVKRSVEGRSNIGCQKKSWKDGLEKRLIADALKEEVPFEEGETVSVCVCVCVCVCALLIPMLA